MRLAPWSVVLSLVAASTAVHAQPGEPAPEEMPPPPEAPPPPPEVVPAVAPQPPPPMMVPAVQPPPPPTVDRGVLEDANSGRSWLSPTALTPPAGTWSFSDFELLIVSGSYAVTDQLQITATTLLPIVEDMPFFGMLTGKLQVLKTGRLRGAAQIAGVHARVDGSGASAATVGGVLTLCLDDDCHSHLSGYLGAGFANEDQSAVPFIGSVALAYRVAKRVKLLFEADTGFIVGEIDAAADGFLAWYGLRFTSSSIGVDLGFMKPICDGCEDSGLVMGIPFVAFTYRGLKGAE